MVSKADLEEFRQANKDLSALTRRNLDAFLASLNLNDAAGTRDALLAFLPALVAEGGKVASVLAADWYSEVGKGRPSIAPVVEPARVQSKIRYVAAHLWTPTPANVLGPLRTATDKYTKEPGRATIERSATRNRQRWARVPTGAKTCAFCLTLASRGAVYLSKDAAKYKGGGSSNKYHGDCDCVPTPLNSWDDYPEGYDPEEYYRIYDVAADAAGTRSDLRAITQSMRVKFPDLVRDGVHTS